MKEPRWVRALVATTLVVMIGYPFAEAWIKEQEHPRRLTKVSGRVLWAGPKGLYLASSNEYDRYMRAKKAYEDQSQGGSLPNPRDHLSDYATQLVVCVTGDVKEGDMVTYEGQFSSDPNVWGEFCAESTVGGE